MRRWSVGTAASIPFIQAGSIRALAQSGKTRTSTLANVPAIAESYPGFEAYAWWGVFAPAGTPKAIVSRFADELAASLRDPRVGRGAHGGEIFLSAVGAFAMDSYAARAWGGQPIAARRSRFSAGPRLPEPHERSCSRGF